MKKPTQAWRSNDLFEAGIGYVAVCRYKANGDAELGGFLLDVHCLGVKDAFFESLWSGEIEDILGRLFQNGRTALTPACARKLVQDAVAYAQGLGLPPHEDYKLASRIFGGIEAGECGEAFTFGQDGKPLYVQGPHDSPQFVERVLHSLKKHCGQGNFHYILEVADELNRDRLEP